MSSHFNSADLVESLVQVSRVSKVTKGGRRFGFRVSVLVGDGRGMVGYGVGRHVEVSEAKVKAAKAARASMMRVNLRDGRTIHHEIRAKVGAVAILMRPAKEGHGIIAGSAVRKFCEVVGISDVMAKILGSSNPHATLRCLCSVFSKASVPKGIAARRGKRVLDIIKYRLA